MITIAKPFRNKENYAKYLALYFEPGLTALLTTLEWCYKGHRPIEEHLADLGATNSLRKTNTINATEQNTLEELKEGKTKLNDLDITLIYKIIQLTCDLLPRNDVAWTKHCPISRQEEQEHLLFQLKAGRNELAHPRDYQKNITDFMVEDKCKEMKDLLTKLLQAAALKANLDLNSSEFNKVIKHIEDDVQRILKGENVCDSMSDHTLDLILTDLKALSSFNDLFNSSFIKELEDYSAPLLKNKEDSQFLKDILQLNKSPVIVVQGEAGMGKTTMSRFLFNSWLSGNTDPVEGLSSFEVVIRVECNQITTRDISQFYETLLPGASFAFPNTVSLKKSLDEFRVFWIMDGFDESTAEFKGFLTAMTKSLSEKHKLLITTRPNTYADLKDILSKCKLSMTSLTLELLQDHNVEEIIQSLIIDDEQKENFKTHFISIDETSKHLLRTPLNLNLYIILWIQDPQLVRDTYTTKLLFLKTIYHNLSFLPERLVGQTCLTSEELKTSLKDWFFGSLCKQSFLILMRIRSNFISSEDLDSLKKDARKFTQNTSSCLSTFLVQGQKFDWEDKGESKNEEENKEKFRYEFHHLTQQYILASLFLKHFKDYDGENVMTIPTLSLMPFEFLKFYVEMIIEDGSLDTNLTQVFSPIQSIMNRIASIDHKSKLWLTTSVASNFNEKYMEKVSQAFKDIPYLDVDSFLDLLDLPKFLEFVHPQKVIISKLRYAARRKGFQALLDVLSKSQIEIELREINFTAVEASRNIQVTDEFYGFVLLKQSNWKHFKKICININFYNDFRWLLLLELTDLLQVFKALEHFEIWINFDSFLPLPDEFHSLPKEIVEITTLGLTSLNKENFEEILEFLIKVKDDDALKFKALQHDFVDISEVSHHQLQQVAYTVSNNLIGQCIKHDIEKVNNLNLTSYVGPLQILTALNAHHANLKAVYLSISHRGDFRRTFKFLHANKTNLSDVKIRLNYDFPTFGLVVSCIFPFENRTIENDIPYPRELVQHTTIFIPEINKENFQDYFTCLNNLKGDETLKFKAIFTEHSRFTPDQRMMLDLITCNSTCIYDIDYYARQYLLYDFNPVTLIP